MSNLGWYQILVIIAKKVGGPKNLIALLLGSGTVIGVGVTKLTDTLKQKVERSKKTKLASNVYTITKDGESEDGIKFKVGDQFKVLTDVGDDILLIEKVGDNHNPYCVSAKFIRSISNYGKTEQGI